MPNLENLIPGPKGDRFAGRDAVVLAIKAALLEDFESDESVRFALCKQDEFPVTEAARDAVVSRKAMQLYELLVSLIVQSLRYGDSVAIAGFASWIVDPPVDEVTTCGYPRTIPLFPIYPDYVRESETVTVEPGMWGFGWQGELWFPQVGEMFNDGIDFHPMLPRSIHRDELEAERAKWAAVVFNKRADSGVKVWGLDEVGVSDSGHVYRQVVGPIDSGAYGWYEMVEIPQSTYPQFYDYYLQFRHVPDQAARFAQRSERIGKDAGWLAENVGMFGVPAGPHEWSIIAARKLEDVMSAGYKEPVGLKESEVMRHYPKRRRVCFADGIYFWVGEVTRAEFLAANEWRKNDLIAAGAWPKRLDQVGNRLRVIFQDEFAEAVRLG